jgi:hypothetical protein
MIKASKLQKVHLNSNVTWKYDIYGKGEVAGNFYFLIKFSIQIAWYYARQEGPQSSQ